MRSSILFLVILLILSGLTLTVGTAGPVAPIRPLSTLVSSASENILDLTTFGAVGDGIADDGPALQTALNALADAGGGTLLVPAGRYAIITPVLKDFSGSAASLTILGVASSTPVNTQGAGQELTRGLDLTSEFVIRTGTGTTALALMGLDSLLISEMVFIGTQEALTDAQITLGIYAVANAAIRHCEFYGLSTMLPGGAVVHSDNSRLTIDRTVFLGCTGNSGVSNSVVLNTAWRGFSVTETIFADYGQRPNYFGKLGLAAAFSWIMVGNTAPATNLSPRREAIIRNVFLDEGGFIGISVIPDYYDPQSAASDLIYISDLRMNVSSLNASGIYLTRARRVLIERAKFGLSRFPAAAVNLVDVGEATLDRLECLDGANTILANGGTSRLTVINSIYTHLDSLAQTTEVITTGTEDEDPVQYLRKQYLDVLGHEPDAAGHDYWSDILLECGADEGCLATERVELSGYLGTGPSALFSVTGQILNEHGAGMPGVALNLSGSQAVTTQTDTEGNYRFEGLPTSGAYTVTPVRVNYTFPSSEWRVTTPSADQVANFSAILNHYGIAGRVLKPDGVGLAGVSVTLSGSQDGIATTDLNGAYSFTVPGEGDYAVSASRVHYAIVPQSKSFVNLSGTQSVNFGATLNQHLITGRVSDSNGSALAGVTISLSGFQSDLALTGPDGLFSFTVPAGGSYTLLPTKTNYLFTPASAVFTDLDGTRNTTFSATLQKTLEFSAASYQIVEGETSLVVTVVRNGDISGPATATYSTSDNSGLDNCNTPNTEEASAGCDYITSIGTVRFAPGETSKTLFIPIIDDGYAEGSESFEVTLSNLAGVNMGSHGTANVTIADNETVNGTNPIENAGSFVRQHYIDFFNREPDTSGLTFWTNQITSCGSDAACLDLKRANASAAFFLSIEFQETGYLVYRMYQAAYGNLSGAPVPVRFGEFLPDTQQIGRGVVVGQTGWEQVLENNKEAFAADFVARPRFTAAHATTLTPTQFVDALFTKAGVTPSADERTAAINEFGTAGTSADLAARGRALGRVAENQSFAQQEFNKAFVLIQYFGYLRRNPNDAPEATLDFQGYNFWLGKLNQFNGDFVNADMVKAFIVSGEYRQRFGP